MTALHLRPDQWQDAVRDEQVRPERDAERHGHTPHANRAQSRDCRFHCATSLPRLRTEITTALSMLWCLLCSRSHPSADDKAAVPVAGRQGKIPAPQGPGRGDVTNFLAAVRDLRLALTDISQMARVPWPGMPALGALGNPHRLSRAANGAPQSSGRGEPLRRVFGGIRGIAGALHLWDCCSPWKRRSCQERPWPQQVDPTKDAPEQRSGYRHLGQLEDT
jgi:hypothetical protein